MSVRVTHTDAYGKQWVFSLNCNPEQEQVFRRFLSRLHAPKVTAGYGFVIGRTTGENAEFRATVEHVVLSALRDWTAAGSAAYKPEPLTVSKPTPTRTENATAPLPPPPPEPEEREPYYWENF